MASSERSERKKDSVRGTSRAAGGGPMKFRIEHDSLGEVKVPAKAKWAAQTQRAVENFPISGLTIDPSMVAALAAIKGAVAMEKSRLKMIKGPIAKAISQAADEIIDGAYRDQFPVDVYQTGSGTSS